MIHVIATIQVKEDSRDGFLEILRDNVPRVTAEKGCLQYKPCVDMPSGLPAQDACRQDTVVLLEAWEDLEALQAHLRAPHMLAYREAVKDLVREVRIQVLEPV